MLTEDGRMLAALVLGSAVQLAQVVPGASPLPASACVAQTPHFGTVLTESSPRAVGIGAGDPVVVMLRSNPSTGYGWSLLVSPPSGVRIDGKVYVPDAALDASAPGAVPPVGGGGVDVWHVSLLQSGTTQLIFRLFPPGASPTTPETKLVRFTISAYPRPPLCP